MKTNSIPFLTREEFDKLEPNPDVLFPIWKYEFCKKLWEESPLIIYACEELMKYKK